MKKQLLLSILALAANSPEGFTIDHANLQPVQNGYAVAVAATQNSFGRKGLSRVIDFVQANAPRVNAFGGWYNSEDGKYYFDATIIVPSESEARALAIANMQKAYYDLNTCTEVRL